jgi:hypothetical protein
MEVSAFSLEGESPQRRGHCAGRIFLFPYSVPTLPCFFLYQIPHSLFKESGYDHREALFGMPPYGGSIAQNVYYADQDMCGSDVDTSKGFPARAMDKGVMKPWDSPFILMVDRGGCTFVKKVGADTSALVDVAPHQNSGHVWWVRRFGACASP